jgi:hypothetical protein
MYGAGYRNIIQPGILTGFTPVQDKIPNILSNILSFYAKQTVFDLSWDGLLSLGKYKWAD